VSRPAHFKVYGKFRGGASMPGTVTIDRDVGLFTVRPYKKQTKYELPLSAVAEFVVWHCVKKDVKEEKARKKRERADKKRARQAERRAP
jgi:hypothetical protein